MQDQPPRPKHQRILQRVQTILVIVAALLISLVFLLEMFDSHAYVICFIAYMFGALAYVAEIVVMVLRAKEHMVHRADLVMPIVFGLLYIFLAVKYLAGNQG